MIQYNIANDYITVKFEYGNIGVNTELRQKLLLQVYVCELHIETQKNATGFYMEYDEKVLVLISDSALLFILPPK